ncbi:RIP metalloprotease RseP [Clostridium sp. YIM B02551]|uniref:RIP metalloprotease RseP n=1 Tax=Clostridium sp. YIM B02551 TaxID=2910679 RepID=UPI001EEB5644
MYIILAILAFSVLIIVHELGHFIMAKVNGVRVDEFSIGFGPRIIGVKIGETDYCLRILPFGGRVAMLGEEGSDDEAEGVDYSRSLNAKHPLRKISIIIAGVAMNYLLAIIIFLVMALNLGITLPEIKEVIPNSAAEQVGLKQGDKFLKIDDVNILTSDDVTVAVAMSKGSEMKVRVQSGSEIKDLSLTPKLNKDTGSYQIGFYFNGIEKPSFGQSVTYSMKETVSLVKQTFLGFKQIFSGKANLKTDVGGPVTIIKMSGAAAKAGIWNLLFFVALISVNLAVLNLLPFPALDGGWAFFILIELITGKKIPPRFLNAVNSVGLMVLLGLMVLVTIKDIIFPVNF